jgi:hypothetical protein
MILMKFDDNLYVLCFRLQRVMCATFCGNVYVPPSI